MNAASRKRVRDIQRNTQRKRQQIYMIRRACALGILLLILILIISGIDLFCNSLTFTIVVSAPCFKYSHQFHHILRRIT